jgi:hypothetical protein
MKGINAKTVRPTCRELRRTARADGVPEAESLPAHLCGLHSHHVLVHISQVVHQTPGNPKEFDDFRQLVGGPFLAGVMRQQARSQRPGGDLTSKEAAGKSPYCKAGP